MVEDNKKFILELDSISCSSQQLGVLENISISVNKGENIVFFGPENSGLDLLCPLITGFEENYTGHVYYKGESVKEFDYITHNNFRKNIGYLHPDFGLLSNMSVEQNISLPLEYHSFMNNRDIRILTDTFISLLNLEYCKKLRPNDLTESESLKTAYARSIALDPDVLLIEHASGGQSTLNIISYYERLRTRSENPEKSVIIVTYYPKDFLKMSNRYIMLFNGKIVFEGDKNDYLNSNNPYLIQYKNIENAGPMAIL